MTNRRAFTLVELLVVIGIIAVMIALLLPALNRARQSAYTVQCSSNLRQIATAVIGYAADNKGLLPYGYNEQHAALTSAYTGMPALIETGYLGRPSNRQTRITMDGVNWPAVLDVPALICPAEPDREHLSGWAMPFYLNGARRSVTVPDTFFGGSAVGDVFVSYPSSLDTSAGYGQGGIFTHYTLNSRHPALAWNIETGGDIPFIAHDVNFTAGFPVVRLDAGQARINKVAPDTWLALRRFVAF